jgi:hypothetical protein
MFQPSYKISDVPPSQTDAALVSAKTGVVYSVFGGFAVVSGTATTLVLNSKGTGAGTAITSTLFCGANGGIALPLTAQQNTGEPPFGYFESNRGEGITATTGAGSTVGISLVYIQI